MERMTIRALILLLLLSSFLFASSILDQIDSINKKIPYATKGETVVYLHKLENLYITCVVNKDRNGIARSLRSIIRCRKLLNMDYDTYENELKSMGYKEPPKIINSKKKSNYSKKKVVKKLKVPTTRIVKDIYIKENTIVIKFNKPLGGSDINFYTKKDGDNYIVAYEIKAKLSKNAPIYLNSTIDRIKLSKDKANYILLLLKNKDKIYSKGFIRGGNLFVKINNKKRVVVKKLPSFDRKKRVKPTTILVDKKSSSHKYKKEKKKKVEISSTIIKDSPLYATSKIIVIDPGHGGKDSGAIGYKNHYEKVAVLKVAKFLSKMLKKKGYRVYMTRDSDRFITLKNRTHMATQKNADLFVSIHANAAPKGKRLSLKGIETFFLSPARTNRAKRVAEKENRAASSLDRKSKNTVLDFLNRTKILQSNKLAIDIQSSVLKQTRAKFRGVKDGGVREAPFWVLVGAQMPAVLVEIGYITNPMEGDRLYNPFYQKALAKGIYQGINNYFAKNR